MKNIFNPPRARVIALYLPQYHPTPENDKYWGKGFTEWTNVGKAKPQYRGHYQPRVPADLGYYDLRLPEVREAQAEMAREAGVEGFAYWHYWFGNGQRALSRPFDEVLKSGKPDFPFCLFWANHSWTTKTWDSKSRYASKTMIFEQTYPGETDERAHFEYVLPAFKDPRYIRIDNKPVFGIHSPLDNPRMQSMLKLWQQWARDTGLPGIHFIGFTYRDKSNNEVSLKQRVFSLFHNEKNNYSEVKALGFDAVTTTQLDHSKALSVGYYKKFIDSILKRISLKKTETFDYNKVMKYFYTEHDKYEDFYPMILPQEDRTARFSQSGHLVNSTPANFERITRQVVDMIQCKEPEHRIIILRSWNEWAEGNYMEPDLKYGHGFLNALHNALS